MATEVICNSRVVDLMLGPINQVWVEWLWYNKVIAQSLLSLSQVELEALAVFACNSRVSVRSLSRVMYCTETDAMTEYLIPFTELGLITNDEEACCYRATEWIHAVPECVVAVELKLYRWREVFQQALCNKQYSDASYAVLDWSVVDRQPRLKDIFRQENIGLIGLSDDGLMTMVVKPKRNWAVASRECCYRGLRLLRSLLQGDCNTRLVSEGGDV